MDGTQSRNVGHHKHDDDDKHSEQLVFIEHKWLVSQVAIVTIVTLIDTITMDHMTYH